jgi:hypothetical protein
MISGYHRGHGCVRQKPKRERRTPHLSPGRACDENQGKTPARIPAEEAGTA